MIQTLKKWYFENQKRKNYTKFRTGLTWAIRTYYNKQNTVQDLKDRVQASKDFGDYTDFDTGVERGIRYIEYIGK